MTIRVSKRAAKRLCEHRLVASLIGRFWVKHFQAVHQRGVDVARGLALLFGIGTAALPSWDSKTRWNNLLGGLAVNLDGRSKRPDELTSSIVPRGTSFHHGVELEFPPIAFDPLGLSYRCYFPGPAELGAVNPDVVHDHGQATRQRCRPASSRLRHITEVFLEPALTDN